LVVIDNGQTILERLLLVIILYSINESLKSTGIVSSVQVHVGTPLPVIKLITILLPGTIWPPEVDSDPEYQ
jgi:hypothetical protein